MEEARRVLERLARIEELETAHAPSERLLAELRELVREAEAWVRVEPQGDDALGAVERCSAALRAPEGKEAMLLAR